MMRKFVVLVLSLTIVAAACGGDDDASSDGGSSDGLNEAEQALADAIALSILEEEDDPASPLGPAEAECIGEGAVGRIGIDGLLEIGISEENPNPEDALEIATDEQIDTVIDVFIECVDFTQAFIDGFAEAGDLSPEAAGCLAEQLQSGDLLKDLTRSSMRGDDVDFDDDPELAGQILQMVLGCLSPEELVDLGG